MYLSYNGGPFFRRQRVSTFMESGQDFRLVLLATFEAKLYKLLLISSNYFTMIQFAYLLIFGSYILQEIEIQFPAEM